MVGFLILNIDAGGSPVNAVQRAFNGLGQLTDEYQAHQGNVAAGTPEVRYAYSTAAQTPNASRPTATTYPNGRVVDDVYNPGLDSAVSRLSALADDSGGTPGTVLEAYTYLGLGTVVRRAHPQPGVDLTSIRQAGDAQANADGGDPYTGLDRFGRVIDQNWRNTATGAAAVRLQYGHDRAGNVLSRNDLVETALSQLYSYDSLNRLSGFSQGTLSGGTIPSPTSSQSWGLDALGNWSGVTTNGATVTRAFNAQNQATSVSGGTAPTFDASGNTTGDSGLTFVYDAWDRLAAVKNSGGTTVAGYAYDPLGRRVTETYPVAGATNELYYSPRWQVIEERRNGTAAANVSQQYVWSPAGIDTLVLRDSYSGGAISQRLYALQDANQNTTALVDTGGAVRERYAYAPYGDVTVLDAGGTPRAGNASGYYWQYLFQGGRQDATTGWYGFRHRDYIAAEGRWAEKDPWGFRAGDPNFYRFVDNNPTNGTDPSGLAWVYPWDPNANWGDWRLGEAVGDTISNIQVSTSVGGTGEVYLGIVHIQVTVGVAGGIDLQNGNTSIGVLGTVQGGQALGIGYGGGVTGTIATTGNLEDLAGGGGDIGVSTPAGGLDIGWSDTYTSVTGSVGPPTVDMGIHLDTCYTVLRQKKFSLR